MTLLGKIFTGLIFIASIILMSIAVMVAASHKNWKNAVIEPETGLQARLNLEKDRNAVLQEEIEEKKNALNRERTSRAAAISTLTTKTVLQSKQLEEKERELAAQTQLSQERLARMQQAEARLAEQDVSLKDARDQLQTVVNDLHYQMQMVVTLTDQNHQVEWSEQALKERAEQLANDVATLKKVMDAYGLDKNSLTAHIPPQIDGRVTAISNKGSFERKLVEINLGSDDGLREGHELDVFRNNQYLGRVVIREVSTNRAVAQIIPDLNRGSIKENDRVTTRFRS